LPEGIKTQLEVKVIDKKINKFLEKLKFIQSKCLGQPSNAGATR
jgi:hypothetical protein